jgi:23S rRNA (guanosine2251-2'-O)-methyltransferase
MFRFPVERTNLCGKFCPKCGTETILASEMEIVPSSSEEEIKWTGVILDGLLDNIRSTFNVGSIFRTADGAGFHQLHLCGITPTPENPKVGKTALGAEKSIPWTHYFNSLQAAQTLKENHACLWALEKTPRSGSLFDVIHETLPHSLVLIAGNEIAGVDPGLLDLCDRQVWIPMQGMKESLNVSIAFSIAAYLLRYTGR